MPANNIAEDGTFVGVIAGHISAHEHIIQYFGNYLQARVWPGSFARCELGDKVVVKPYPNAGYNLIIAGGPTLEDRLIDIDNEASSVRTESHLLGSNPWTTKSAALPGITNSHPLPLPITETVWFIVNSNGSLALSTSGKWGAGCYTKDQGVTWTAVPTATGLNIDLAAAGGIQHYATDANGRIWAAASVFPVSGSRYQQRVFYSDTSGDSWIESAGARLGDGVTSGAQPWKIITHPQNQDIISVLGYGIFLTGVQAPTPSYISTTLNRGLSWTTTYSNTIRQGQSGVQELYDAFFLPTGRMIIQGPFETQAPVLTYTMYTDDYGATYNFGHIGPDINHLKFGLFRNTTGSRIAFFYPQDGDSKLYLMVSCDFGVTYNRVHLATEMSDFTGIVGTTARMAISPERDSFYVDTGNTSTPPGGIKVIRLKPVSEQGLWTNLTDTWPFSTNSRGQNSLGSIP